MKTTKEINVCPYCFKPPDIGYVCGEHFILSKDKNCHFCNNFNIMHTDESLLIDDWNVETSFHHKRILYYANKTILED